MGSWPSLSPAEMTDVPIRQSARRKKQQAMLKRWIKRSEEYAALAEYKESRAMQEIVTRELGRRGRRTSNSDHLE